LTSAETEKKQHQQDDGSCGVVFYIYEINKYESHERRATLAPLDVIRVETVLSRYPIHRLAKQGRIAIELREATTQVMPAMRPDRIGAMPATDR
jgi:hypothetical protein